MVKWGITFPDDSQEMKKEVNLSAPRPEGRGLLKVHPEPRFATPPSKAGLRAVEWVNQAWNNLSEENPGREDREIGQWVEKLAKFEGLGRKSSKSRSNKSVKPW